MKMNLLALDASTEALSIALHYNGKVYAHFEVCPQEHSQKVLPAVDALLSHAGCSLADLDGLVFGRGPGSFTGVRIGVSIAQGLGFARGLKMVGVSTLQAMAQQAAESTGCKRVLAGIDARMDEVYSCYYQQDENGLMQPLGNEVVIKPEDLTCLDDTELAVGTAWQTYPSVLNGVAINNDILYPNAEFMLKLGSAGFEAGLAVDASDALPHYVRDTVTWKKLPGRE